MDDHVCAPMVDDASADPFADLDAALDLEGLSEDRRIDLPSHCCVHCGGMEIITSCRDSSWVGAQVCALCGVVQPGLVSFERMGRPRVGAPCSNYKRIHHLHERVSQLLLQETDIPPDDMLAIGKVLLSGQYTVCSKETVRQSLRSLGLQKYIERWLQIVQKCTGQAPPVPGAALLMRLDEQFNELQRPFDSAKNEQRRNFLNYNFVLARLFQRLGVPEYSCFFPMIKSKSKIRALDQTYKKMCELAGWEYTALISVPPFGVRLERPAELLRELTARVEREAAAEKPKGPPKRELLLSANLDSARAKRQQVQRRSGRPGIAFPGAPWKPLPNRSQASRAQLPIRGWIQQRPVQGCAGPQ